MEKAIYYRQCSLTRENSTTISWIPEQFAVIGKILRLKDEDGTWENGWVVQAVYERREESQLPDSHRQIKQHRKNTGDSLPKEQEG